MSQWNKIGYNLILSHILCMHEVAVVNEPSC